MRIFVMTKVFDTVSNEKEVMGNKMQEIVNSGKLVESGNFVDARAGYFVFDVDSASELCELLYPMQEICHIETHPIQPWEKLHELFEKVASK